MDVQFHGRIKDGKWTLNRGQVFDAYIQGQPDGDYYLVIHKAKIPKTLQQLAYYYAVVVPTVRKTMIEHGNDSIVVSIGKAFKELPLTIETVDAILKEVWAKTKGVDVKSKARMSIKEASELIDISIMWAARYLGCVIPPPDTET
jgi:hypothetical protein